MIEYVTEFNMAKLGGWWFTKTAYIIPNEQYNKKKKIKSNVTKLDQTKLFMSLSGQLHETNYLFSQWTALIIMIMKVVSEILHEGLEGLRILKWQFWKININEVIEPTDFN